MFARIDVVSNSIFSFAKSVCVCVSRPIYGSLRAMHDQCYATLCIQSDSPGQHGRSWGKTEPHMFRLFAALLLNYTRLPLYVVHNEGVHPLAILADAVPLKSLYGLRPQVHPFKVDVIKSRCDYQCQTGTTSPRTPSSTCGDCHVGK